MVAQDHKIIPLSCLNIDKTSMLAKPQNVKHSPRLFSMSDQYFLMNYNFSLTLGFLLSGQIKYPVIEWSPLTDNKQAKAEPLHSPSNHLTQSKANLFN
jgi:hypothetical protein